jgi:hypothetical protein
MALALVGAFAGIGNADMWTKIKNLGTIGVAGIDTYQHDMPGDFSIPPDQIISATSELNYSFAGRGGSYICKRAIFGWWSVL